MEVDKKVTKIAVYIYMYFNKVEQKSRYFDKISIKHKYLTIIFIQKSTENKILIRKPCTKQRIIVFVPNKHSIHEPQY